MQLLKRVIYWNKCIDFCKKFLIWSHDDENLREESCRIKPKSHVSVEIIAPNLFAEDSTSPHHSYDVYDA